MVYVAGAIAVRSLLKPGELQPNQLIVLAVFQYRVVGTRMGTLDSDLTTKLQQTFQVQHSRLRSVCMGIAGGTPALSVAHYVVTPSTQYDSILRPSPRPVVPHGLRCTRATAMVAVGR